MNNHGAPSIQQDEISSDSATSATRSSRTHTSTAVDCAGGTGTSTTTNRTRNVPPEEVQQEEEEGEGPAETKKGRRRATITDCPHIDLPHYGLGRCKRCYFRVYMRSYYHRKSKVQRNLAKRKATEMFVACQQIPVTAGDTPCNSGASMNWFDSSRLASSTTMTTSSRTSSDSFVPYSLVAEAPPAANNTGTPKMVHASNAFDLYDLPTGSTRPVLPSRQSSLETLLLACANEGSGDTSTTAAMDPPWDSASYAHAGHSDAARLGDACRTGAPFVLQERAPRRRTVRNGDNEGIFALMLTDSRSKQGQGILPTRSTTSTNGPPSLIRDVAGRSGPQEDDPPYLTDLPSWATS